MHQLTEEQAELAKANRVATEYVDWRGAVSAVPAESVVAVLEAVGGARDGGSQVNALPACIVVSHGQGRDVVARLGASGLAAWVELEDGGRLPIPVGDLPDDSGAALAVPADLPLGYHRLRVTGEDGHAECALIVTPPYLGFPEPLGDSRAWGIAAQLYSVRSRRSWGVGDLADLREMAAWAAGLGADFLLLNPLFAAEPVPPMEPSPYLPSSRLFTNPLYLAVESTPEYGDLEPDARAEVERLADKARQTGADADLIDRDAVWQLKRAALEMLHRKGRSDERHAAYRAFVEREGRALRDFATWCVLAEERGPDWHEWPASYRNPDEAAVADFRRDHAERIGFHGWLQWLLDEQLADAQRAARDAGMRIGIMHDLAVGVHPSGADSWALQDCLALGVTVGAPPDAFNQLGQDWSQPPWRPDRLAERGYAPYRDVMRRLLRHAGAVRIDHVIGLFRLWLIPQGASAGAGTYVGYDHEALIGILALEGLRTGAVVVGEDLGNVEPAAREYLASHGIVGTSLLWFERDDEGRPLAAERWRECSLASVGTHDLPPTAGYLVGDHVLLRERLGMLTRPLAEEREADEADRAAWLGVLRKEGLVAAEASTEETVTALYEFLTRTPARLVCVLLTDAVGDRRTQNQPGTTDEYPNWRVPLSGPDGSPITLEDVMASERARRLARTVDEALRSQATQVQRPASAGNTPAT